MCQNICVPANFHIPQISQHKSTQKTQSSLKQTQKFIQFCVFLVSVLRMTWWVRGTPSSVLFRPYIFYWLNTSEKSVENHRPNSEKNGNYFHWYLVSQKYKCQFRKFLTTTEIKTDTKIHSVLCLRALFRWSFCVLELYSDEVLKTNSYSTIYIIHKNLEIWPPVSHLHFIYALQVLLQSAMHLVHQV